MIYNVPYERTFSRQKNVDLSHLIVGIIHTLIIDFIASSVYNCWGIKLMDVRNLIIYHTTIVSMC